MKDDGWLGCMISKANLRKRIQTKTIVELHTWAIDSSLSPNVLVSKLLNIHSIIIILDCAWPAW